LSRVVAGPVVGCERIAVTLHTGRLVEGVARAIVERSDGVRLQVEIWRVHRM
jgi:hypothetical protein